MKGTKRGAITLDIAGVLPVLDLDPVL